MGNDQWARTGELLLVPILQSFLRMAELKNNFEPYNGLRGRKIFYAGKTKVK